MPLTVFPDSLAVPNTDSHVNKWDTDFDYSRKLTWIISPFRSIEFDGFFTRPVIRLYWHRSCLPNHSRISSLSLSGGCELLHLIKMSLQLLQFGCNGKWYTSQFLSSSRFDKKRFRENNVHNIPIIRILAYCSTFSQKARWISVKIIIYWTYKVY